MTNEERLERAREVVDRLEELRNKAAPACSSCKWACGDPQYMHVARDWGCANPVVTARAATSTAVSGVVTPEALSRRDARDYHGLCGPDGLLWEKAPLIRLRWLPRPKQSGPISSGTGCSGIQAVTLCGLAIGQYC